MGSTFFNYDFSCVADAIPTLFAASSLIPTRLVEAYVLNGALIVIFLLVGTPEKARRVIRHSFAVHGCGHESGKISVTSFCG